MKINKVVSILFMGVMCGMNGMSDNEVTKKVNCLKRYVNGTTDKKAIQLFRQLRKDTNEKEKRGEYNYFNDLPDILNTALKSGKKELIVGVADVLTDDQKHEIIFHIDVNNPASCILAKECIEKHGFPVVMPSHKNCYLSPLFATTILSAVGCIKDKAIIKDAHAPIYQLIRSMIVHMSEEQKKMLSNHKDYEKYCPFHALANGIWYEQRSKSRAKKVAYQIFTILHGSNIPCDDLESYLGRVLFPVEVTQWMNAMRKQA